MTMGNARKARNRGGGRLEGVDGPRGGPPAGDRLGEPVGNRASLSNGGGFRAPELEAAGGSQHD